VRVSEFDFSLPDDLIALRPVSPRDSARLLIVHEGATAFEEARVRDLPSLLTAGDLCVFNDTKVIPAQLFGVRPARGASAEAAIEVTLHKRQGADRWAAFAKPGRKLQVGDVVRFGAALAGTVEAKNDGGEVVLRFDRAGADLDRAIAEVGVTPLPPYIAGRRPADERDEADYQTIFAAREGAVAAPTAGLHFTPDLLAGLDARGVRRAGVTLHVGAGTFLPVKADDTGDHVMHAEWGEVSGATADAINAAARVGCIGTTSLRIVESAAGDDGQVRAFAGDTRIFITPGYRFKAVDVLLTNFHLPRSTLFMLVSAFCGIETMRAAYAHAIAARFRFYSYGDACLLIRKAA
jgi:S-adenosylmethionine:tRNA ribosyltransferase-isomerase